MQKNRTTTGPSNSTLGTYLKKTKQKKKKQLAKKYAHLCSLEHYLQKLRYGANLGAHQ